MSDHFRAQGEILVDEGVDLLILETPGSTARTIEAMVNATKDLGVPVWVSISCVRDRDSGAMMLGIEESSEATHVAETYSPLAEAVREIMYVGGSAVLMMHSVRDVTEDAVKVMRTSCSGPVGAYPNAGYWTRPNWTFVDQVSPDEYLADARRWIEAGAAIVGGLLRSGRRAHTCPRGRIAMRCFSPSLHRHRGESIPRDPAPDFSVASVVRDRVRLTRGHPPGSGRVVATGPAVGNRQMPSLCLAWLPICSSNQCPAFPSRFPNALSSSLSSCRVPVVVGGRIGGWTGIVPLP